jgi:hypothetical protein
MHVFNVSECTHDGEKLFKVQNVLSYYYVLTIFTLRHMTPSRRIYLHCSSEPYGGGVLFLLDTFAGYYNYIMPFRVSTIGVRVTCS